MKFLVSSIISAYIIGLFYTQQPYYLESLKDWEFLAFFFLITAAFSASLSWLLKSKREISTAWIFPAAWLASLLFGGFRFFEYQFAKVQRVTIVEEGSDIVFLRPFAEIPETAQLMFSSGDLVQKYKEVTAGFPPQALEFFEPAAFGSLGVLMLNIVGLSFGMVFLFMLFSGVGAFLDKRPIHATGLGMLFFSILLFFLAALNIFTQTIVIILTAILFLAGVLNRKVWLDAFKTKMSWGENKSIRIGLFSLTSSLFGLSLIDAIRTVPIGWDDLSTYARNAKMLGENQIFPSGIGTFAWSNLSSVNWVFADSFQGSALLSLMAMVLGFVLLIKILRNFTTLELSWSLSIFFFTLPFLAYQQVIDLKTDIPLLFIGLLAIFTLINLEIKKGKEKTREFLLLGIFLGFAFAIKITALILIASVAFAVFLRPKINLKKSIMVGVTILLVSLPWLGSNIASSGELSISKAIFGEARQEKLVSNGEYCDKEEIFQELDYGRFTGGQANLLQSIRVLWDVNFTPDIDEPFVDFSILFLAVLPFYILFPKRIFQKNSKAKEAAFLTGIYLLIWLIVGRGVIWYGVFGLVGGLILFALLLKEFKGAQWKILVFLLIMTSFSNIIMRSQFFAQPHQFANALGVINNDEIREYIYPGYQEVADLINQEENPKLYYSGVFIPYFVGIPDEMSSPDNSFEYWSCIENAEESIRTDQFAKKGITHVLVHETPAHEDKAYIESHTKMLDFLSKSNWELLYNEHGLKLFRL